ncbi:hypothetical protein D3C80_1758340 [compost metagenome]
MIPLKRLRNGATNSCTRVVTSSIWRPKLLNHALLSSISLLKSAPARRLANSSAFSAPWMKASDSALASLSSRPFLSISPILSSTPCSLPFT